LRQLFADDGDGEQKMAIIQLWSAAVAGFASIRVQPQNGMAEKRK